MRYPNDGRAAVNPLDIFARHGDFGDRTAAGSGYGVDISVSECVTDAANDEFHGDVPPYRDQIPRVWSLIPRTALSSVTGVPHLPVSPKVADKFGLQKIGFHHCVERRVMPGVALGVSQWMTLAQTFCRNHQPASRDAQQERHLQTTSPASWSSLKNSPILTP